MPRRGHQASFENVAKWFAELKENATADITMTMVGNKARPCRLLFATLP